MTNKPKLKGKAERRSGPHPLGEIPNETAILVGKQIVHRLAVGQTNITGDDFGNIFARAIEGQHKGSPLGIADVVWHDCAWSVKTVQHTRPFNATALRFISGRNSPDYSLSISNPRANIHDTGRAVLSIWNSRVDEALKQYNDLRFTTLVRNMKTCEFLLFEEESKRYIADNYRWEENQRGNFDGYDIKTDTRCFTWQPHGAQFTIHRTVPTATTKFRILVDVPIIKFERILELVQYSDDWIEFQP